MRNVTRMPTRWKCFRCIFVKKSGCVCVCVCLCARAWSRWLDGGTSNVGGERWTKPKRRFLRLPSPIPIPIILPAHLFIRIRACRVRRREWKACRWGGRGRKRGEGTVFGYNIIISSLTSSMEKRNTYNFLNMYVCMFLRMIVGYIFGYKSSRGDI